MLEGHGGGVTERRWSACGNYVYSGARRDDDIVCWDVRSGAGELYRLRRRAATNQKVQFDIEPAGRYLLSGGTDGRVRAYDLRDGSEVALGGAADGAGDGAGERGLPVCDGGAAAPAAALALNPAVPLLLRSAPATGSRRAAPLPGVAGGGEGAQGRRRGGAPPPPQLSMWAFAFGPFAAGDGRVGAQRGRRSSSRTGRQRRPRTALGAPCPRAG